MRRRDIRCPHCFTNLTVSGEAAGAPPSPLCPSCGRDIDGRRLLDGDYDVRQGPSGLTWLFILWALAGPAVLRLALDWPFWKALPAAWGVVLLYAALVVAFRMVRRR